MPGAGSLLVGVVTRIGPRERCKTFTHSIEPSKAPPLHETRNASLDDRWAVVLERLGSSLNWPGRLLLFCSSRRPRRDAAGATKLADRPPPCRVDQEGSGPTRQGMFA